MFNNMYGYVPPYMPQMQRLQQMEQQYPQYAQPQPNMQQPPQPNYQPQQIIGLQGKSVESLEIVKAIEIPLDGSVTYFPLADGSAIVTKQLQEDGKSKMVVYKPVEMKDVKEEKVNYVTKDEVEEMVKNENNGIKDLKEELKNIKRQMRDITDDIKELKRKD